jgi:hypothetical protein
VEYHTFVVIVVEHAVDIVLVMEIPSLAIIISIKDSIVIVRMTIATDHQQ